jgi:hypothetical protein
MADLRPSQQERWLKHPVIKRQNKTHQQQEAEFLHRLGSGVHDVQQRKATEKHRPLPSRTTMTKDKPPKRQVYRLNEGYNNSQK